MMLKTTIKKIYPQKYKNIYGHTERGFEKLTNIATAILGNSITFIIALGTVIFWLTNKRFYTQDIHSAIGDVILGVTFLYLFIIQKSFIHFSASLHLKVNELIASHKTASNAVMNAEQKTEDEITELSKEYTELAEQTKEVVEEIILNQCHKTEVDEQIIKVFDGNTNT